MNILGRSAQLVFVAAVLSHSAPLPAEDAGEDYYSRFTREVMGALERKDAVAMALLVHFPLRVNLPDDTTILIDDELSLKRRFEQIFPAALRKYVLETEKAGTGENGWAGSGYMFDHGALWAQNYAEDEGPSALRIETVNASLGGDGKSPSVREILFACETTKHRIVIDSFGQAGAVRYRAWNKPRFLPDPPDLTLVAGNRDVVGHGACAHALFKFAKGDTQIAVQETRCSAGSDAPPDAARATVSVSIKGEEKQNLNCF